MSAIINGGGGVVVGGIAGNTSGATANISTGTMVLAGGNNITLSQNGNSVTISALGVTNSFLALGTANSSRGSTSNRFVFFRPFQLQQHLSVSAGHIVATISGSSNAASSYAGVISVFMGVYTRSGSTLNLLTSAVGANQFSDLSGGSAASISGNRKLTCPVNFNLPPGDYWLGLMYDTNTTNANWFTVTPYTETAGQAGVAWYGAIGNNSTNSAAAHPELGRGLYSAVSASLPASVAFNQIQGGVNAGRNQQGGVVYFNNFNT